MGPWLSSRNPECPAKEAFSFRPGVGTGRVWRGVGTVPVPSSQATLAINHKPQPKEASMALSNKATKQLNKALAKHSAQIIAVETQGNGHNSVTIALESHSNITVRGVPSTPRDINHTANHLRQAVGRALAANSNSAAYK